MPLIKEVRQAEEEKKRKEEEDRKRRESISKLVTNGRQGGTETKLSKEQSGEKKTVQPAATYENQKSNLKTVNGRQVNTSPGYEKTHEEEVRQAVYDMVTKKNKNSTASGNKQESKTTYQQAKDYKAKNSGIKGDEILGRMTTKEWSGFLNQQAKEAEEGKFNSGYDVTKMNDAGLDAFKKKMTAGEAAVPVEMERRQKEYDDMQPESAWGDVQAYLDSLDKAKAAGTMAKWDATQEERAEAKRILNGEGKADRERQTADNLFYFFPSNFNAGLFRSENTPEEARQILYDSITEGSYKDRVAGMTTQQKAELDKRLDSVLQKAYNRDNNYDPDYEKLYKQQTAYADYKDKADEMITARAGIRELESKAAGLNTSGGYDPSVHQGAYFDYEDGLIYPNSTEMDRIHYYANERPSRGVGNANKAEFMTDDQLDTFNKFYKYDTENGTNYADSYLKGLDTYLSTRKLEYEDYWNRQTAENPYAGPIARAFTYPMNVVSGAVGMAGAGLAALGVESAKDESSEWYAGTRFVSSVREQQNEMFDDWLTERLGPSVRGYGQFVGNVFDSIVDNWFAKETAGALTGGFGPMSTEKKQKAAMSLIQLIMSNEAGSARMVEALEDNKSPLEAALSGISSAVIEWFTEKASIEAIWGPDFKAMAGDAKAKLGAFLKASLAEGSEEINADVLNDVFDVVLSNIFNHKTEIKEKYDRLIVGGMDPDKAAEVVRNEELQKWAMSGLAGGLSGGLMVGGRIAANQVTQNKYGQNISSVDAAMKDGGASKIIEEAKKLGTGSQSYDMAVKIENDIKNGKKVSNKRLGQLSQMVMTEASEQAEAMEESKKGQSAETQKSINQSIREVAGIYNRAANLAQGYTAEGIDIKTVGEQMATEEDLRTAEGERTTGPRSVIVDGKYATLKRVENGRYVVEIDGHERTVDASDIRTTEFRTAAIMRQRAQNPGIYNDQYTNTLLDIAEQGNIQNIGEFLMDALLVRLQGYAGTKMQSGRISEDVALRIYNEAVEESRILRENEVRNERNYTGKLTVPPSFNGAVFGTDAWTEALDSANLSDYTREQIESVARLAAAAGINGVTFQTSDQIGGDKAKSIFGSESKSGIMLNIEGEDVVEDENGKVISRSPHHIMVSFGHEMTHWLQRNSLRGYNQLRVFVLQSLEKEGVNLPSLILDKIGNYARYGENIDINGAIAEIVANACDQILNDDNMAEQIRTSKPGLYGEIQRFVKDLVDRVRKARKGMQDSASFEARMMNNYMTELRERWLSTLREVQNGETADEVIVTPDEAKNFSLAQLDDNYMAAVHMNETAQQMVYVDEAARRNRFDTDPAYPAADTVQGAVSVSYTDNGKGKQYTKPGRQLKINAKRGTVNKVPFRGEIVSAAEIAEQARQDGYDSVRIRNIKGGDIGIFFDSDSVRSADPVTFDGLGLVVPVSERFSETPEARYSFADQNTVMYLKGRVQSHVDINKMAERMILRQYNISDNELIFGIEFNEDGEVNQLAYTPSELFLIRRIGTEDMKILRELAEDTEKWRRLWKPYDGPVVLEDYLEPMDEDLDDVRGVRKIGLDSYDLQYGTQEQYAAKVKRYGIRNQYARLDEGAYQMEGLSRLDREYMEAAKKKDYRKATSILMDRLKNSENIIPYIAPRWYSTEHNREVAKLLKKGNRRAIVEAAADMATYVPDNAVLIPMPPSSGVVNENTDTMKLARAIGQLTGRPVVAALEGNNRPSRSQQKFAKGTSDVTAEQMGFRQVQEIPADTIPIFIDNVVGSGETAKAAYNAMRGGITLAYAKTSRTEGIPGLKSATWTEDTKTGEIIPLSQRFNPDIRNVRYSFAEKNYQFPKDLQNDLNLFVKDPTAFANKYKSNDVVFGETPFALQMIGINNKPLAMRQSHLDELIRNPKDKNHDLKVKDLMDIIRKANNPVAIIRSKSNPTNSLVIIVDHIINKRVVVVPVQISTQGNTNNVRIDINRMSSAYGKDGLKGLIKDAINVELAGNEPGIYYTNKNKTDFLRSRGFQLPFGTKNSGLNHMITDNQNFVNQQYLNKKNTENAVNDLRKNYSLAEGGHLDVRSWMMGLTESSLQTESERILLHDFKDLRIRLDLCMHRQDEYQKVIRQLEAKETLTPEEQKQLTETRNRLEIQQQKQQQLEAELFKITDSEGYAGMMYRQSKILNEFVYGKTQEQVRQAVEQMEQEAAKTRTDLQERAAQLKKLAESQAIRVMKSYMNKSSLDKMSAMLRKSFGTSMNKSEIENRLAAMALKLANGENIMADAEALAQDMADKIRGERSDALESLKGTTLIIGQEMLKQLKAENSSLKELRSRIRGSGVTIRTEQNSRLDEQWRELRESNNALPDLDDVHAEIDKLHTVIDWIAGELENSRGSRQYEMDMADATAQVLAAASNVTTYLVNDPEAKKQIDNLMKDIEELAKGVSDTAQAIDEMTERMEALDLAGKKAVGWASVLQRDVNVAIDYYNKMAKLAAETERQRVRESVIESLKSENAKKLVAQQEKYEELIRNDKKARALKDDNESLRKKTNTVLKRARKMLMEETDQKNIPEEAKPLVRMLLKLVYGHDVLGYRRVSLASREQLDDIWHRLLKMDATYGAFDAEKDLEWLVVHTPNAEDNDTDARDRVMQDLMDIESGLLEYRNAEGRGTTSLMDRKAALEKIQKAASEIWSAIQARQEADIAGRKWQIYELAEMMQDDMKNSRFKGERIGKVGRAVGSVTGAVGYGNLTPEFFFKNLKNRAMNILKKGLNDAEQRSGLEALRAKMRIAQIAEETGYNTWDGQEMHDVKLANGKVIQMTTEQIMSLYATWMREQNQMRPEDTAHLLRGGFVLAKSQDKGWYGREKTEQRPIRVKKIDLNNLSSYLTEDQIRYVEEIVGYMSNELAEIGNEASMRMFGIKKFTEQYYFPIRSWGGVLNSRSDAGVNNNNENRSARQSFTKRLTANASNAIEIGDFTPTAMKHIVGMINYNTVAPAVEYMNRVLNQQLEYGEVRQNPDIEGLMDEVEDERYKRNMRAAFQEAYGKQAYDYLTQFMKDINGGVSRRNEVSLKDKLLGLFKKNAVGGSLSVAAQQPLSYIRAAMMINPKYLAAAINPRYWRGSFSEMMAHSGIAVIKDMGKFDMNYGRSMIDYITPEAKESKGKAAWNRTTDMMTALPQKMDAMTWTRMWTAVKLEQMAENKGMDFQSEEFMQKVAERFNDLMRRTQVYDSVMVKSQNMRSDSYLKKVATSFMAEPTLSLNVLADAWQNIHEKGGKANAAKALATFLLSAAAQAGAKAFFGTGRSPDKKKNREENFLNKYGYNLISELNPLGLIPGYNQLIDVLQDGELNDDAMGMIGKAVDVFEKMFALATGNTGNKGLYRDIEDSVGQMLQLATDIPLKNLMRDFRAMVNFFSNGQAKPFTGDEYAQRQTSGAVLKYQMLDTLMSDDLIGIINQKLGDAGYKTDKKSYYDRIYQAMTAGNKERADELREYATKGLGVQDKTLKEEMVKRTKADEGLNLEEKVKQLNENEYETTSTYVLDQYREGKTDRRTAEKLYRQENPKADDKTVMETFDKIDWKNAGKDDKGYTNYTPLYTAVENNKSDEIRAAVRHMMDNGYKAKDIQSQLKTKYKTAYTEAKGSEKIRMQDALVKAYKATGMSAAQAEEEVGKYKELVEAAEAKKEKTSVEEKFLSGKLTRSQAETELKKTYPKKSANDIWFMVDRLAYQKETGKNPGTQKYYRLYDAVDKRDTNSIRSIVQEMKAHGTASTKKGGIVDTLMDKYGKEYMSMKSGSQEQVKLKNILILAMQTAGVKDANNRINSWVKKNRNK